MTESDDIASRKSDHVEIVLNGGGSQSLLSAGFDDLRFENVALPEMSLDEVDLSCKFLGRGLNAPLLISSMTGGYAKGARINEHLAEAAQARRIALAVGSQRIAIEAGAQVGLDGKIRSIAPDIPIYANFGGAQLVRGYDLAESQRAIELLGADALIIHLNPLQEAVQTGGDLDWSGLLRRLESLVNRCEQPIIVKEVGFGISGRLAKQLLDCGVAAIDVAGAGGTNWALVESHRALTNQEASVASVFEGWGIPTVKAICDVRQVCPDLPVIGSGGVRNGVDVAKAIRVGADIVGMAGTLLKAATQSADAVDRALGTITDQLRIACFCTGSRSLGQLRTAHLVE